MSGPQDINRARDLSCSLYRYFDLFNVAGGLHHKLFCVNLCQKPREWAVMDASGAFTVCCDRPLGSNGLPRLSGNFYFFGDYSRLGNRISKLTHAFQMSFDCLSHQASRFFELCRRTDASRQIRYMGAVPGSCWSVQYGVFHFFNPACSV